MAGKVDESACKLVEQHGKGAAYMAVERLNESIDQGDRLRRDFWAQVVHAIHEYQRSLTASHVQVRRNPRTRGPGRCWSLQST
jgi:hypothetical protein